LARINPDVMIEAIQQKVDRNNAKHCLMTVTLWWRLLIKLSAKP